MSSSTNLHQHPDLLLKVADDDRQWKGHCEGSTHCCESSYKFSEPRDREDVAVAHSGHGDDHPVEGGRDVSEPRVVFLPEKILFPPEAEVDTHHLNVVGEAGEDEAGDDEDHHEESQLRDTLAECVDNGLEAPGVSANISPPQISPPAGATSPRQLQYPGQLEDPEDLDQALERVVLLLLVLPVLQTTGGGRVGEPARRGLG